MFDIKRVARESGLPEGLVKAIIWEAKREFPDNELLFELHVIRAIEQAREELGKGSA